ncbi:MAG: hypothetical protein FJW26_14095 [Acidimicrobiia bacterium]|nr:hypothetical protein [Acidimicrobiia bacterium]
MLHYERKLSIRSEYCTPVGHVEFLHFEFRIGKIAIPAGTRFRLVQVSLPQSLTRRIVKRDGSPAMVGAIAQVPALKTGVSLWRA